jgi:hypothetical protein
MCLMGGRCYLDFSGTGSGHLYTTAKRIGGILGAWAFLTAP